MIKFKGFDDWIPVFQGGRQIDSAGCVHDGDALIDKALATFNAAKHEPPVVIGHPVENAPAYGWVEGLKKQGNLLLAKFKQVEPGFADMVKRGLFKKRSAAFYPDGTLRHVGFLGAVPPAVKGLPDVAFAEANAMTFEFSDYQTVWAWESIARLFGKVRDYLIEKDGMEKADQVISAYQIEEITAAAEKGKQEIQRDASEQTPQITNYNEKKEEKMNFKEFIQKLKELVAGVEPAAQTDPPAGKTFSEADLEAARRQAADEAARAERERAAAEFAERERTARQEARKREISAWCASMVDAGRMTPAMVKFGLPEMLAAFAEREEIVEFGEAKDKATLYDRFKALFETELPKVVEFREVATRDRDTGGQGQAGAKVEALIQAKLKDRQDLSYGSAFAEVQRENPDLAREYRQEIGG
jgi:hypothetical protein